MIKGVILNGLQYFMKRKLPYFYHIDIQMEDAICVSDSRYSLDTELLGSLALDLSFRTMKNKYLLLINYTSYIILLWIKKT